VNRSRRKWKRFQPFSAPAATKPLKRLGAASPAPTGLKPGANERLQESEMRPTKVHAEISRTFRLLAQRQPPSRREGGRAGAVQDASRISGTIVSRAASWSATALRRFSQRHIETVPMLPGTALAGWEGKS
jgi:hypothetical protein